MAVPSLPPLNERESQHRKEAPNCGCWAYRKVLRCYFAPHQDDPTGEMFARIASEPYSRASIPTPKLSRTGPD